MTFFNKTFKKVALVAAFFSLSTLIVSCGEETATEEGELSLTGSWSGPHTITKNGLDLVDSEAILRLGDESFFYENTKKESAEGTYSLVGTEHIKFTSTKSTSKLFPAENSVVMSFKVQKKSIIISNSQFELILNKISDSAEGSEDNPREIPSENAFIDSSCNLTVNRSFWNFKFKHSNSFELTIDTKTNFAIGNITLQKDPNVALLDVTKTSVKGLSMQKIYVSNHDVNKFKVDIFSPNDEAIFSGYCFKLY
jgi:hypothetical protein